MWYLIRSMSIKETINIGLNAYTLVTLLIGFIIGVLAFVGFIIFFLKKEWRLYKNRERPIMVFKSESQNMNLEMNLLRDSKLFSVNEPSENFQDIDRLDNHSLIIVGYSPEMKGFRQIIEGARNKKVPIIVYAKYESITDEDNELLASYSYYSICNLPLRLMNDVFTILSTFPK